MTKKETVLQERVSESSQMHGTLISELKKQIEDLQRKCQKYEKEMVLFDSQLLESRERSSFQQNENGNLKNEIRQLKSKISEMQNDIDILIQDHQETQKRLQQSLSESKSTSKIEVEQLKSEVRFYTEQSQQWQDKYHINERLKEEADRRILQLEIKSNDLLRQLNQQQSVNVEQYKAEIQMLQNQIESWKDKHYYAENSKNEAERRIIQMEIQINEIKKTQNTRDESLIWKQKFQELELQQTDFKRSQNTITSLEQQLQVQIQENQQLKEEMDQVINEYKNQQILMAVVQTQRQSVKKELNSVNQQQQISQLNLQIDKLKADVIMYQKENKELEQQVRYHQGKTDIQKKNQEIQQLQNQIKTMEKDLRIVFEEQLVLEKLNWSKANKVNIEQINQQYRESQIQVTQLKDKITQIEQNSQEFKSQTFKQDKFIKQLQNENKELEEQILYMQKLNQNESKDQEINSLKIKLRTIERDIRMQYDKEVMEQHHRVIGEKETEILQLKEQIRKYNIDQVNIVNLQRQIVQLEGDLNLQKNHYEDKLSRIRSELQEEKKINLESKEQQQYNSADSRKIVSLQQKVQTLETDLYDSYRNVSQEQEKTKQALQQIKILTTQLEQVDKLETELEIVKERNRQLEKKLIESNNYQLKKEEEYLDKISQLQRTAQNSHRSELLQELSQKEIEILQKQLQELQSKYTALEVKKTDVVRETYKEYIQVSSKEDQQRIKFLEEMISQMKDDYQRLENKKKAIENNREYVPSDSERLKVLKLEQQTQELEICKRKHEQIINELEQKIRFQQSQIQSYEFKVRELESELSTSKQQYMSREVIKVEVPSQQDRERIQHLEHQVMMLQEVANKSAIFFKTYVQEIK